MGERTAVEMDVRDVTADIAMVDLLARLALAAGRCGYGVRLRGASPELLELIELAGLTETLPAS